MSSGFRGWTLRAMLLVALVRMAEAQTVRYVDWDAAGSNNGSSWANAYTNLQDAFAAAVAGDSVWVTAGTYKPTADANRDASFVLKSLVKYHGGFSGSESTTNQRVRTTGATILSGDIGTVGVSTDNSRCVVRAVSGASDALLDRFTIESSFEGIGISGSTGGFGGGGLWIGSPMTVQNCVFRSHAGGTDGGAVHVHFVAATIRNCVFSNNTSTLRGGALQIYAPSSGTAPFVENCAFFGNFSGGRGGALAFYRGPITMRHATVAGNSCVEAQGQAMYASAGAMLELGNSIFWDSGDNGGGIYVKNETGGNPDPVVNIAYSDIRGGYAPPGGQGTGSNLINTDPLFVNSATGDLRLQVTSPCKDAATAGLAPVDDLDGGTRPTGAGPDMGAYEFGSVQFGPPTGLMLRVR